MATAFKAAPGCDGMLWLWVFNCVDRWYEVGDGAMCVVGEEELPTSMPIRFEPVGEVPRLPKIGTWRDS